MFFSFWKKQIYRSIQIIKWCYDSSHNFFYQYMSRKVPTGVYVNQNNVDKLSSCIQNQNPCMVNVDTSQRKGAVIIYVFSKDSR